MDSGNKSSSALHPAPKLNKPTPSAVRGKATGATIPVDHKGKGKVIDKENIPKVTQIASIAKSSSSYLIIHSILDKALLSFIPSLCAINNLSTRAPTVLNLLNPPQTAPKPPKMPASKLSLVNPPTRV